MLAVQTVDSPGEKQVSTDNIGTFLVSSEKFIGQFNWPDSDRFLFRN